MPMGCSSVLPCPPAFFMLLTSEMSVSCQGEPLLRYKALLASMYQLRE